ncbi:MAG: FxLD family lanthipeptide [Pseudonocardiaceae bacterium]
MIRSHEEGNGARQGSPCSTSNAPTPATVSEFDLDVSIVESGPVVTELMRLTDDGCGQT